MIIRILIFIGIVIFICTAIALLPVAVARLFQGSRSTIGWSLFLIVMAALGAWTVRDIKAKAWKSDQHMHIRWNVDAFSSQYDRIDKLGNEDLRRDYVSNFCANACTLLNLDQKTAPNTSNLVERYYFDWDDRISEAESAAPTATVASACSAALGECARIFEAEMRDGVIHGATVMAGGLDGDAVSASWGWADAAHTVPMTPRTVVDIASVTKAAAGTTAFLVAHAKGLVDFDAPFTNYLSAYRAPLARVVTVRDLMNHLSGFGEADGTGKRVYFSDDPARMLDNVLAMPPAEPKKGEVAYSCRNYVLLGRMLEQIAGCGVDEFARREIFLPAGMADSSLGAPLPSVSRDRLAQTIGTQRPGEISDFVARPLWGAGIGTLNAGMFSTAEDLARLLRTYLRGGVTDGGVRIFGEAEMSAIAPSATNRVEGTRSFGWQTASADLPGALFGTALFHSGWSGQTVLFDLKRRRYAIVLTTRCGDYARAKRERLAAIAALLSGF